MNLILNYIYPHEDALVISTDIPQGMPFYDAWLDTMVKMDESVIFFYTVNVVTTDIPEEVAW